EGGEAEQRHSKEDTFLRGGFVVLAFQQVPFFAVVEGDPAGPVDFVEEPVHDQQKHENGEQTGNGLDVERINAFGEVVDDTDDGEPCGQGGDRSGSYTRGYRAHMARLGFHHAGGDGGENEDALQPFTKDEDGDIENSGEGTGSAGGGVGIPGCGEALPDQHGENQQGPCSQNYSHDDPVHGDGPGYRLRMRSRHLSLIINI